MFYVMVWDTTGIPLEQALEGAVVITPQLGRITIYGTEEGSPYPEDQEPIRLARQRGYVFGNWFSERCPQGEWGSNHDSVLTPITREQFEKARELGWPSEVPT